MDAKTLSEYFRAPGMASLSTTMEVREFLTLFNSMLVIYRGALGEPVGQSVESHMDKVDWYVKNGHWES